MNQAIPEYDDFLEKPENPIETFSAWWKALKLDAEGGHGWASMSEQERLTTKDKVERLEMKMPSLSCRKFWSECKGNSTR